MEIRQGILGFVNPSDRYKKNLNKNLPVGWRYLTVGWQGRADELLSVRIWKDPGIVGWDVSNQKCWLWSFIVRRCFLLAVLSDL